MISMDLVLQFLPYAEIEFLNSSERVTKLLKLVKQNKILILEGRLRKEEEADLIQKTMEEIDESFKGVELGTIDPSPKEEEALLAKLKSTMFNMILGERRGLSIIGPANVVKQIKQDPEKIQLFMQSARVDTKRKKRRG